MVKINKLIWSNKAKNDLNNIYKYYSQFSLVTAKKLINKIIKKISILKILGFENSGQIDEYNKKYRRLISSRFKIFYKVFEKEIVIIRIFNCSQNPKLIQKF